MKISLGDPILAAPPHPNPGGLEILTGCAPLRWQKPAALLPGRLQASDSAFGLVSQVKSFINKIHALSETSFLRNLSQQSAFLVAFAGVSSWVPTVKGQFQCNVDTWQAGLGPVRSAFSNRISFSFFYPHPKTIILYVIHMV